MRFFKCTLVALLLSGLQIGLAVFFEKVIPATHHYWFDQFSAGALTAWWALYLIQPYEYRETEK